MAKFAQIDLKEAQAQMRRRVRQSKWRNFLDEFVAADIAAARVDPEDDKELPGSIASGLNNALKRSKEAGSEYPVTVSLRTLTDNSKLVIIQRTDMELPEDELEGDETEIEDTEDDEAVA